MTHRDLTESLVRPPGIPPSQCGGETTLLDSQFDSAQAGEGGIDDVVNVDRYRCDRCHAIVVVRSALNCQWLGNEIPATH